MGTNQGCVSLACRGACGGAYVELDAERAALDAGLRAHFGLAPVDAVARWRAFIDAVPEHATADAWRDELARRLARAGSPGTVAVPGVPVVASGEAGAGGWAAGDDGRAVGR